MQLTISEEVVEDLKSIWDYIALDKPYAADKWIAKLHDTFENLARTPGIGHVRKDLTDYPVLFWSVGEYLVIYRHTPKLVEIIAVTQGSRHIPALLSSRLGEQ